MLRPCFSVSKKYFKKMQKRLDFLKQLLYNNRRSRNAEMSELAEGARLEIVCTAKTVPRVRIPFSAPIRHLLLQVPFFISEVIL